MYGQGGFSPRQSLLSGLSRKGAAGQAAYGQAMAGAAGLGMKQQESNQQLGVQAMQQNSQLRQQQDRNRASSLQNQSQERIQQGSLDSRGRVFDTNMAYDYAGLNKRRNLQWQQALVNNFSRDF